MAGVFPTVSVNWQGVDYDIVPNMKLINEIENRFGLARFSGRIESGDPPLSHLASILAMMLRHAGAEATDEEVMQDLVHGSPEEVLDVASKVLYAVWPQSKKSPPPAAAKPPAKRRKS